MPVRAVVPARSAAPAALPRRGPRREPWPVILETDQALLAVTKTRVLGNAAVAVTFDPPARPWIQALKTPAVNFFLFDIRENAHRRDVMYEQVLNEEGRVVGHRP